LQGHILSTTGDVLTSLLACHMTEDKKLHTFRQLPKDLNDQNKRNLEDDIQCASEGYYV
jgi:hypothetical protein